MCITMRIFLVIFAAALFGQASALPPKTRRLILDLEEFQNQPFSKSVRIALNQWIKANNKCHGDLEIKYRNQCQFLISPVQTSSCSSDEWLVLTKPREGGRYLPVQPICAERKCVFPSVWWPSTGKCLEPEDSAEVCGKGNIFRTDPFGDTYCDCLHTQGQLEEGGPCYRYYQQGPCEDNEVLVYNPATTFGVCAEDTCHEENSGASRKKRDAKESEEYEYDDEEEEETEEKNEKKSSQVDFFEAELKARAAEQLARQKELKARAAEEKRREAELKVREAAYEKAIEDEKKAREAELRAREIEAQARAKELEARAAEEKRREADLKIRETAEFKAKKADAEARASELRARVAEEEIRAMEIKARIAEDRRRAAEKTVRDAAEKKAREDEEEARELELQSRAAEKEARENEEKIRAAETRTRLAIEKRTQLSDAKARTEELRVRLYEAEARAKEEEARTLEEELRRLAEEKIKISSQESVTNHRYTNINRGLKKFAPMGGKGKCFKLQSSDACEQDKHSDDTNLFLIDHETNLPACFSVSSIPKDSK